MKNIVFSLLFFQFSFTGFTFAQYPVKIMPLGNSITQGWTDGTLPVSQMKGYRYDLKLQLQASGYAIDFVGSEVSGDAYFTDYQHAGIGGSRDQYVARLLLDGYDDRNDMQILVPPRPYLDEYDPDIILLHIGTNDITHEADPASIQQISYILDLIDQHEVRSNREVLVFVARIINRKKPWVAGSGAATTTAFNNTIESIVLSRIAGGDKLVLVDMENDAGFVYDATDMADNLHPNSAGYLKMASLWYASIINNYNTAPVISAIPDQTLSEGGNLGPVGLDAYVTDLEDADGDLVWSVSQVGTPQLDITLDGEHRFTVSPVDPDWYGTQQVVFNVTDNGKNGKYVKTTADTVLFIVTPANDPPVFSSSPLTTINTGEVYAYNFSAYDVDPGEELQYSLVLKPGWLTLYPESKLLAGAPVAAGEFPVTLRASDGESFTDQVFVVQVNGASPVPEHETRGPILLYPNPADDHIILSIPGYTGVIVFRLYTMAGKPMLVKSLGSDDDPVIRFAPDEIQPGLYLYQLNMEDRLEAGKLMIVR